MKEVFSSERAQTRHIYPQFCFTEFIVQQFDFCGCFSVQCF